MAPILMCPVAHQRLKRPFWSFSQSPKACWKKAAAIESRCPRLEIQSLLGKGILVARDRRHDSSVQVTRLRGSRNYMGKFGCFRLVVHEAVQRGKQMQASDGQLRTL